MPTHAVPDPIRQQAFQFSNRFHCKQSAIVIRDGISTTEHHACQWGIGCGERTGYPGRMEGYGYRSLIRGKHDTETQGQICITYPALAGSVFHQRNSSSRMEWIIESVYASGHHRLTLNSEKLRAEALIDELDNPIAIDEARAIALIEVGVGFGLLDLLQALPFFF